MGVDPFWAEYTPEYYRHHRRTETKDHHAVARVIVELFHPRSVIDIACATGNLLEGIQKFSDGPVAVRGVDSPHLIGMFDPTCPLVYPALRPQEYVAVDLRTPWTGVPWWATGPWDLAICTEAAEHLPEEAGHRIVELLTQISRRVLWSAAVPGQGGTGHITERDSSVWRETFLERGWDLSSGETDDLNKAIATTSWHNRLRIYRPREG